MSRTSKRDRAALLDAEPLQVVDDVVGGFPCDVGGDLVTGRVQRGPSVDDDVRRTGVVAQDSHHIVA